MTQLIEKPCTLCPFREESVTFRYRDDWLKKMKESGFESRQQGCHMKPEGQKHGPFPVKDDLNLLCVGHLNYIEKMNKDLSLYFAENVE